MSLLRRMTGRTRKCAFCGTEFLATQEFRSYKRRFCSQSCYGRHLSEKARATYPPREEIERLYVIEGLTDRAIAARYGRSYNWVLTVRKHYGIAGTPKSAQRKPLSRQRDRARWGIHLKPEDCCRNCGSHGLLALHHAIPRSLCRSARYDIRNGLPLCARCHIGWHHHRLTIYRDLFTRDEWSYLTSLDLGGQDVTAWLDDHYPARLSDTRALA